MLGLVTSSSSESLKRPTFEVAVATMARALRQAAAKIGYQPDDTLIALMLAQMVGAEGTMPGLWNGAGFTFRGTNNVGASQVPGTAKGPAFAASHRNGWGAFAHKDSNPGGDDYIGWYFIAPSAYEAALHWVTGYGAVEAALRESPQDPQSYAALMYANRYFTGTTTDGASEIAKYASRIESVLPHVTAVMNGPSNDPTLPSVDTTLFAPLSARQISKELYDKAMAGQSGSDWKWLLPSWPALVASNGVVWFGSKPGGSALKRTAGVTTAIFVGAAAGGPVGAAIAAAVAGGWLLAAGHVQFPKLPSLAKAPADPKAVQTKLNALGFGPLTVDGDIGPLSQAAITKFQAAHGLPQTGAVDSATRRALGV